MRKHNLVLARRRSIATGVASLTAAIQAVETAPPIAYEDQYEGKVVGGGSGTVTQTDMTIPPETSLTAVPKDFRWITWEIGMAELQKSVMSIETFEALSVGITHVEGIRSGIRQRRKLMVSLSTGEWTKTPSDRFINEHAWVLAEMNQFGLITAVNRRTKVTSLLPGAAARLPAVVEYFQRNEPFVWKPGPYKKAAGW
jgi:hypothetical protein